MATGILFGLGLGIGALGTLIGAGGGWMIVPILLLGYGFAPQQAVGTSLAVVFLNALSGSIAYMAQRRVLYRMGTAFAAATIPGALLGAWLVQYLNSKWFSVLFGLFLLFIVRLSASRTATPLPSVCGSQRDGSGPAIAPFAGDATRDAPQRPGRDPFQRLRRGRRHRACPILDRGSRRSGPRRHRDVPLRPGHHESHRMSHVSQSGPGPPFGGSEHGRGSPYRRAGRCDSLPPDAQRTNSSHSRDRFGCICRPIDPSNRILIA